MRNLIFTSALLLIFSCSKPAEIAVSLTPIQKENAQLLKDQVDITPNISPVQQKIKNITVSALHLPLNSFLEYQYDNKDRITNITSIYGATIQSVLNVVYDDANKILTEYGVKYNMDNAGLIVSTKEDPNEQLFIYKNGFPLRRISGSTFINIFDKNGNIINRNAGKVTDFEYTNLPNTIRQEIRSTNSLQLDFRDVYAGKFSANLLKKCSFLTDLQKDELNFSYELDDKGRVMKMLIDRTWGTLKFVYTYEYTYF